MDGIVGDIVKCNVWSVLIKYIFKWFIKLL